MYGGGGGGGGAANANTLFGGGGFMPSQSTAVPESSGGSFSKVRLVGRMLGKVDRVTDVQFILDDGTGKIDVNRWENESSDAKEMADVNDGNYVIVNGGLKGFQGKRHVVAYSVRRVTNFNDITHHFLQCIHVHLELTRSKPPHINASTATPGHANQVRLPNNQATTFSAPGNTAGNDLPDLVMSVLHDPALIDREDGVPIDHIANRLQRPEAVIKEVLNQHESDGHVYNTIDDRHYKSTLNG
ncbi:unnamed protein product [Urochloa decumbens]|uniref:Replication protein A C-terminal domain-containing protein n=1 Tax=Urochloa decumbens TaxID=240449 RepID=A0ABC9EGU5_9POAL